jgi:hypothetical protein
MIAYEKNMHHGYHYYNENWFSNGAYYTCVMAVIVQANTPSNGVTMSSQSMCLHDAMELNR